ncbi:MAG: ATP-binding protein [Lachnospiraceae bacterium]|nr:ATP-binding protein [Lachnospiraceae bacterium]
MTERNPYVISFGKMPKQYIDRTILLDELTETLNADPIENSAFILTGIRGSGKTVTLTDLEKRMRAEDDWIIIGLKSNGEIVNDLLAELYSCAPFLTEFIDAELNLSGFGIGIKASGKPSIASADHALRVILKHLQKKKKRVLITIDEARKTEQMLTFIQSLQILIREDLPIFLVAAGLYEDIESLEDSEGLTFLTRAEKYEMKPLNLTLISKNYQNVLGVSRETAEAMAALTKGYAFAYQALGKYMWEKKEKEITEEVLALFDEVLADKVYDKIWEELTPKDRWYLGYIATKETISAAELLELTKTKHNEWSVPRKRLKEKGIINTEIKGKVSLKLPRFEHYVLTRAEEER